MTKYICGDCGKEEGLNHSVFCDIERCPKCLNQLLSCDCKFKIFADDDKILTDEKGVKYTRFKIEGLDEDFNPEQ